MKDGEIKGTGNSRYLKLNISPDTTIAEIIAMLNAGTFPIDLNGINLDGWNTIPDWLNKANLLSDATCKTLGISTNSVPNDAFIKNHNDIYKNKELLYTMPLTEEIMHETLSSNTTQIYISLSGKPLSDYRSIIVTGKNLVTTGSSTTYATVTLNGITADEYYDENRHSTDRLTSFGIYVTPMSFNLEIISDFSRHIRQQFFAHMLSFDHYISVRNSVGGIDSYQTSLDNGLRYIEITMANGSFKSGGEFHVYGVRKIEVPNITLEEIRKLALQRIDGHCSAASYYSYLKDWIERETDVDILNGIEYGSPLPNDLMQELAKSLAGFGIDITKYDDMLGEN